MTVFPLSDCETRRITALYQLAILDTPSEKEYDHIVALAAQVCDRPFVTLGFLDHHRIWYKARIGIKDAESPVYEHDRSFQWEEMTAVEIEDTLLDDRAANFFYVQRPPYVRSVTMFPLLNEQGDLLGYLSVGDTKPGLLTEKQYEGLEMLAMQAMTLLNNRQQLMRKQVQYFPIGPLEQVSPVFKNAIDAVIITSEDGLIRQWNPRAEEIFGYKAREAIGKRFHELLIPSTWHGQYFERLRELQLNDDGLAKANYEFIAVRKDCSELHVALGISPVLVDNEVFYIGFMTDITERKQITKALARQKKFYENILNKIPMEIAVFDANQKYLYVNPAGIMDERLREYIIGKDEFEYAAYRNRDNKVPLLRRSQFLKAKVTHRTVSWEDQVINKEGRPETRLRKYFPVYKPNGNLSFVIGYGLDITERKCLEEEQDHLLKRLSFQNTQLTDFCNIVTHNLRGPLNNISMLVGLVEGCKDHQEQQELTRKLKPVIEGLKSTFDELVETTKIKQDLEVKSEMLKLEDCLQKNLKVMEMEIRAAKAQVIVDCSRAPVVYFPPKYMDSIFHNLISNALKYRSPDRVLNINVSTRKKGSSIFLTVQDNGLGIDLSRHKDDLFKIGQVFHNHANAKGLGLYMTKMQIEVMGGSIGVESEVDKGTSFRIAFKDQPG